MAQRLQQLRVNTNDGRPGVPGRPPMVPGSPTDSLMSPASAAIRKRMPKKHAIGSFSGLSLENDIGEKPAQPFAPLCLGTSSQNRIRIAKACGWEFEIRFPDIDEKAIRCDDPLELPLLIAKAKADKLLSSMDDLHTPMVIITADQISLFKEAIREKPCDVDEARQFLRSYSNDTVTTVSAMVATHVPSGRQATAVDVCSVTFGEINDEVVERVVARGRIMQSAGGFAIEDEDLYPLIKDMDGTAASILGFSVESAVRIVQEVSE